MPAGGSHSPSAPLARLAWRAESTHSASVAALSSRRDEAAPEVLPLSDVVAVASGTPFVGGCVFPVLCFRFWTAAASSAFCASSRRRLCASCPVSGVPLAPSLPVLACAPAALAAVLRAVRAGFFGSPRHLTRHPMRRFGGAGAPFSTPVRAGSRTFRVCAV